MWPEVIPTHCPRERDDLDMPGACAAECRRGRGDGRAGRVDVVDNRDARRRAARGERIPDVRSALSERETALAPRAAAALQEPLERQLPRARELYGELLGRVVTSLAPPFGVSRDEREHVDLGPPERLRDDVGRNTRESPEAFLLPRDDDALDGRVVRDGRARRRERDAPSGTLAAAPDGPPGRRAAALAERRADPRKNRRA